MGDVAVEGDLALAMRAGDLLKEAASEQAGEDLDGSQEAAAPGLPLAAVDIEAGIGHHHVQMRMEEQFLVPGMENRGASDTNAAVPAIGGDGTQGLGHDAEQDVEHDPAVAEGDGGDLHRQGEDDVEVGHRQDVCGPRLAPSVCGHSLAGRTVPVAAGVLMCSLRKPRSHLRDWHSWSPLHIRTRWPGRTSFLRSDTSRCSALIRFGTPALAGSVTPIPHPSGDDVPGGGTLL